MGFLENNETMAWLNQAGGGCPCQYAGCTDPAANNYNASASVDDGSCTYPQISCYKCVGSNLVGNNFNGPSCPGGWNAYPMSCGGGGGPIRNFSGEYFNQRGGRKDELEGCRECRTSYDCAISGRPDGTGESRCSNGCCVYTPQASAAYSRSGEYNPDVPITNRVRNFSGDYFNAEGRQIDNLTPMEPTVGDCLPRCCNKDCTDKCVSRTNDCNCCKYIVQGDGSRDMNPITPPRMDGRKVQAGGRLSSRVRKGDTDPTDDMGFRRFDGSNRRGFDNDGMASNIWFNARGRKAMDGLIISPPPPEKGRGQSRKDSGGTCYYTCPNGGTVTLPCDEPVSNIDAACGAQLATTDDRMNRFSGNGFTSY